MNIQWISVFDFNAHNDQDWKEIEPAILFLAEELNLNTLTTRPRGPALIETVGNI